MIFSWYIPTLVLNEEFDKVEKYIQVMRAIEPEEARRSIISMAWSSRSVVAIARSDVEKVAEFSKKMFELLMPNDMRQFAVATHTKVGYFILKGDMKVTEQVA